MPNQSNLLGSLWMVSAGLIFVAVTIMVRHLGSEMPAVETAFIRYLFGLILLIPIFMRLQWKRISRKHMHIYIVRGIAHGAAVMLWFFAMARIPLAEVTAISYSTPIFTSIGAIIIFGERIKSRRVMAILIGFIGMLIILRPGFREIQIGSFAQLSAAFFFSISFLFAKRLTHSESSVDILAMLTLFCTLALLPGAIYFWQTPSLLELGWLALIAVFATSGHYAMTQAIAYAPLTVTQPFAFLQLIWAIVFGYWLFDETPDVWVLVGAALIVGAISYMAHRDSLVTRQRARAAASS
ncbi:MAG: drug/metabolite transporter (DMT)-like permease [Planctomycetota bacterium]|jgi:drug/metabolite transporter (DMT)-like permease